MKENTIRILSPVALMQRRRSKEVSCMICARIDSEVFDDLLCLFLNIEVVFYRIVYISITSPF